MKRNKFISFSPDCIYTWMLNVQSITQVLVVYAPNKSIDQVTYLWFSHVSNKRRASSSFVTQTHKLWVSEFSASPMYLLKRKHASLKLFSVKLIVLCSTVFHLNSSSSHVDHWDGANTLSCESVFEMEKLALLHPSALLMVHQTVEPIISLRCCWS